MKFSMIVAAAMIGTILLMGGNAESQVATTSQGNIYPNIVVVSPFVNNAVPVVIVQPQKVVIKPFFPFFNNFFNPFLDPFFNNNFFDPFSGVGGSPLLIP
jgi:hypothetical protein